MREACRVTALTHKAIEEAIKPGMTTADLDRIAEETMKKYGAISAEKGYLRLAHADQQLWLDRPEPADQPAVNAESFRLS